MRVKVKRLQLVKNEPSLLRYCRTDRLRRFFSPKGIGSDILAFRSPGKSIERVLTKRRLVQHNYFSSKFLVPLDSGTKSYEHIVVSLENGLR